MMDHIIMARLREDHCTRKLIKFLKTIFKIRDCKRMDGPCLNYQIDLCNAPCDKKITEEEYKKLVDNVSFSSRVSTVKLQVP